MPQTNQSQSHRNSQQKPQHSQRKPKRVVNRDRNVDLAELQLSYYRLFTGNGSREDGMKVLQDLDWQVMSLKTTDRDDVGILTPDTNACLFQAAYIHQLNAIHNMIREGKLISDAPQDNSYDNDKIRGIEV